MTFRKLKVLVGCEESQEVCKAFRELGHEAYSNDLIECSGGHPEWHIKEDVHIIIDTFRFYTQDHREHFVNKWDLIILHCPCTYTAVCGNRFYHDSPLRIEGANFTKEVWYSAISVCDYCALEQPKTIMQKYIGKKSQVIQPYQYGHTETKETWLWLNGLPLLKETNNVKSAMDLLSDSEKHKIWYASPGKDRGKIRSKTYLGIAKAMASQWSDYILKNSKR